MTACAASMLVTSTAAAQASYRNLDAGFPVRIEDAIVTERDALDLDLLNFRYDELSAQRQRFQYEPRMSYGLLPRTEVWLRLPVFYRERNLSPRGGVAGVGVGAMYQFNLETMRTPVVAFASEFFKPTGPGALPASYSFRTMITRSLSALRLHLNGSIASYGVRSQTSTSACGKLAPGATCGGIALPPLDGPCSMSNSPSDPAAPSTSSEFMCSANPASTSAAQAVSSPIATHAHWLFGAAVDKSLPLSSTLLVADLFAEKFEGIGRKTDATAEIGMRHQVRPQVVFVGAIGRHFAGVGFTTFVTAGMTLSHALQLSGPPR